MNLTAITKNLIIGSVLLALLIDIPVLPARADVNLSASQADLQQQLNIIENQISQYEQSLSTTKKTKTSLINKIKQLKIQQQSLRLQIKATAIKIDQLNTKLTLTAQSISKKNFRLATLRGQLLLSIHALEQEDANIFLTIASNGGFSALFDEIQNYSTLSIALKQGLSDTRMAKNELQNQQTHYDNQKNDAEQLLQIKSLQQKELLNNISDHNTLLTQTKGQESSYQSLLADTKKRAAEIRGRIYELTGGGSQITFGQAATLADWAGTATGIRPAFLLAILTQESNLGKNVGTCNRPGDPPEKSWKVVMKPDRDQDPFLQITHELGFDTDTTPISCPLKNKNGQTYGWGGAMGPAQFIPSTWMGIKDKVAALIGQSPANPWKIRDAFAASSLKLASNGGTGNRDNEWSAALRYFSGGTNKKYRFYADNVLATADRYEKDLADLKK